MPPLTGAGRALGLLCLLAASVVGSGGGNLDSVVARQWGAPGIHPPSPRPLFLRGGARKGRPKATPQERQLVDSLELTPDQSKRLRRHWGRSGEYMSVKRGGVTKRVRVRSILNVMKDKANEMRRALEAVPLVLVDLGIQGVRWVRNLPEIVNRYKQLKPPDEPKASELSKKERSALDKLSRLLAIEDGYAIAQAVRPRLVDTQALAIRDDDAMQLDAPGDKEPAKKAAGAGKGGAEMRLVVGAQPAEAMVHVGSHTYGEVDLEGFAEVLLSCAPFAPGESFIDLGSGTGKAVLCAAALAPFKRATGVEFVRPLHDAAQRLADAAAPLLAELGGGAAAEVRMKLGDALDEDLSRAGVVFAATTCWSDDALARLTTACARAKKGARLINMTRRLALPAADWELLRKVRAQYGRGRMTFFVYRKKT